MNTEEIREAVEKLRKEGFDQMGDIDKLITLAESVLAVADGGVVPKKKICRSCYSSYTGHYDKESLCDCISWNECREETIKRLVANLCDECRNKIGG